MLLILYVLYGYLLSVNVYCDVYRDYSKTNSDSTGYWNCSLAATVTTSFVYDIYDGIRN